MTKSLKIKVCGMKYTTNREMVEELGVDFLGYIFYGPSKRFVGDLPEQGLFSSKCIKVGVFVDQNAFEILGTVKKLGLNYVQLHGKENPKTCQLIKKQGVGVIKAFGVDENFSFKKTDMYEGIADYFLFDTKTKLRGGSGKKYSWKLLQNYKGTTPFFLSGGIGPGDESLIKEIDHPRLMGVDLNSGFESAPGTKEIDKLREFIIKIKE